MKHDTGPDYMDEFPRRLRAARLARGLSQAGLAKRVGMGENGTTVCRFEKGSSRPRAPALCRLADVLRVTTDYLLGRSDNMGIPADSCLHKLYSGLSLDHQDLVDEFVWMLDARMNAGVGYEEDRGQKEREERT